MDKASFLALFFMVTTIVFMSMAIQNIVKVKDLKWEVSSLAVANKILKENIDEMNKN